MTPVYLLSLLPLVYGDLIIDIDVRADPPYIDVRNFISTDVISEAERVTFELQDEQLKEAVANYTNDNTVPEFVYIRKTDDKNEIYENFNNFDEIKRSVKPKYVDAEIVKTGCKSKSEGTMMITTDWKKGGNLTIADKIKHIVYYSNTKLEKTSAWGEKVFEPIPNHGDHFEICTMSVTIEYEATIAGDIAAAYTKKRPSKDGDHYFYAYDVFNVQDAAGLPKSVVAFETITVTYPKAVVLVSSSTTSTING